MQIVIGMWIEMRPTALGVKADTAVFFEATELCRRIAANLTWAFTRARKCTHFFFFFFLYLFPSYEPIPDEQRNPFLEALFTTGILFLRESIPYFLQATLTMPFAFLFSFFVILGQFLPFSFCFDKGFRSA